MNERWDHVKRCTAVGWKRTSWPGIGLSLLLLAGLAFWTPGPFWLIFPSLTPVFFLYFLVVGFLLETLDQDWNDWHLW